MNTINDRRNSKNFDFLTQGGFTKQKFRSNLLAKKPRKRHLLSTIRITFIIRYFALAEKSLRIILPGYRKFIARLCRMLIVDYIKGFSISDMIKKNTLIDNEFDDQTKYHTKLSI